MRKTAIAIALAASLAATAFSPVTNAMHMARDGIGEVAIAPYYTTRGGWQTLINLTNVKNVPVVVKVRLHEFRNSRDVLDFNVAMSAHDAFTAIIRESDDGTRPILQIIDTDTCVVPATLMSGARSAALSPYGFSGPTLDQDDNEQDNSDWSETDVIGGDASAAAAYDRMREGYIEFIVMGYARGDKDGELTGSNGLSGDDEKTVTLVGNAIEQHACAEVDAAFRVANILDTARQFGEPINALKFNFRFLNPNRGVEAGGNAVTWANFFGYPGLYEKVEALFLGLGMPDGIIGPEANSACTIDRGATRRGDAVWDPNDLINADRNHEAFPTSSCFNLITAQEPFDFLEPSLNDAYPPNAYLSIAELNFGVSMFSGGQTGAGFIMDPADTDGVFRFGLRGVDALSATMQRATVINEWSLNADTGSETTWVVTFPTKTFYVDQGEGRQFGINARERPNSVLAEVDGSGNVLDASGNPVYDASGNVLDDREPALRDAPYPPFAESFSAGDNGESCVRVSYTRFDRAENTPEAPSNGGTVISPAPANVAPVEELCYEANVLTFSKDGASNPGPFDSPNAVTLDMSDLAATNGWMHLDLTLSASANNSTSSGGLPIYWWLFGGLFGNDDEDVIRFSGLPVLGFMLKQRDLGDPSNNYASSTAHSYTRFTEEEIGSILDD